MNKGSTNHYTLLLQDEAENDGVGLEEEEEEVEDGLNGMDEEEEEEEEEEEDEEEPMEDSDEEEIFSSSKHRSLPHHECTNLNGQNHLVGGHGNEYQLLNNNDADLKTVLDTPITIWTPTPMSPARRACFIASIMFGILVVATFLWVLPCDVQPCEGELAMRDTEWAVKIETMVISQTQLVRRLAGGHNVLLSYHPSINISSWDPDNSSLLEEDQVQSEHTQADCSSCGQGDGDGHCGLLMLDGNLGRKNWRVPLRECPVGLQCDLLDVSGDSVPDCIVRGSNTMVLMIEARYGTILWHLHWHRNSDFSPRPTHNSTPMPHSPLKLHSPSPALLLPDVNGDGFGDLLFSGRLTPDPAPSPSQEYSGSETQSPKPDQPPPASNQLVLTCGQSGSVLGTPLVLKQCQKILSVTMDEQGISYSCLTLHNEKVTEVLPVTALLHQIMGEAAPSHMLNSPKKGSEDHTKHSLSPTSQRELCQVAVSNHGVCPLCQSKVQLVNDDGQVLWQQDYEHSTVVSWAPLLTNRKCYGAILKVWEWRHITTTVKTARLPASINRRTTRTSLVSEEAESLETEPTYIEKNEDDEINLKFSLDENSTLDSDKKVDTLQDNFIKSSQKGSLTEAGLPPVKENPAEVQPPTTLESPRARRDFLHSSPEQVYEHSLLRHHSKQASASREDHTQHSENYLLAEEHPHKMTNMYGRAHDQENLLPSKKTPTTATTIPSTFPAGMRTIHPTVLSPPGYQLQQIHERLAVLKSNGSVWHEETLASLGLGITRLCKSEDSCLPSIESHDRSVAVSQGVKESAWQVVSSSTTFDSSAMSGEQHRTTPWTLTSIVRKIIVFI